MAQDLVQNESLVLNKEITLANNQRISLPVKSEEQIRAMADMIKLAKVDDIHNIGSKIKASSHSLDILNETSVADFEETKVMIKNLLVKFNEPVNASTGFFSKMIGKVKDIKLDIKLHNTNMATALSNVCDEIKSKAAGLTSAKEGLTQTLIENVYNAAEIDDWIKAFEISAKELEVELNNQEISEDNFQASVLNGDRFLLDQINLKLMHMRTNKTILLESFKSLNLAISSHTKAEISFRNQLEYVIPNIQQQLALGIINNKLTAAIGISNAICNTSDKIYAQNIHQITSNQVSSDKALNRQAVSKETLESCNKLVKATLQEMLKNVDSLQVAQLESKKFHDNINKETMAFFQKPKELMRG